MHSRKNNRGIRKVKYILRSVLLITVLIANTLSGSVSALAADTEGQETNNGSVYGVLGVASTGTSGTIGNCNWTLDSNGLLTVEPIPGTDGLMASTTNANRPPWHEYASEIKNVVFKENQSVSPKANRYMNYLFADCTNLESADLSKLDTSGAVSMYALFYDCSSMTDADLSGFDTSNVTNMGYMFRNCKKLTKADVARFDTSSVTNMGFMFYGCNSLTDADVSGFVTSHVTTMESMFQSVAVEELDLTNFDTSSLLNSAGMFTSMGKLKKLNISSFDMSTVTNAQQMFDGTQPDEFILGEGFHWNTDIIDVDGTPGAAGNNSSQPPRGQWIFEPADGGAPLLLTDQQIYNRMLGTESQYPVAGTYKLYAKDYLVIDQPTDYIIDYSGASYDVDMSGANGNYIVEGDHLYVRVAADQVAKYPAGDTRDVGTDKSDPNTVHGTDFTVPGSVTVTYHDVVTEIATGEKFDMQMTLSDIELLDVLVRAGRDMDSDEWMGFYRIGSLRVGSDATFKDESEEKLYRILSEKVKIEQKIVDENGTPVEDGVYAFGGVDLDYQRTIRMNNAGGSQVHSWDSEDYPEGVILQSGYDASTIVNGDGIQKSETGEGIYVHGTHRDNNTSFTEYLVVAEGNSFRYICVQPLGAHANLEPQGQAKPITLKKIEEGTEGEEVYGAELGVYDLEETPDGDQYVILDILDNTEITWTTSEEKPEHIFYPVADKYYLYIEEKAPTGYRTAEPVIFYVDASFQIHVIKEYEDLGDGKYRISADAHYVKPDEDGVLGILKMYDPPVYGSIRVKKLIMGDEEPLKGAEFTVSGTSPVFGEVSVSGTTDEDGIAVIDQIPYSGDAVYTVEETVVPKGYAKADDQYIKVTADGKVIVVDADGNVIREQTSDEIIELVFIDDFDEDPEKEINGDVETVELEGRDETFTYTVSQRVPFNATSVTFQDTLVDVLEVVGTPGIDASGGTVTVDGNTVTAVLGEDAAAAVHGQIVTLTIQAKIKDGITDDELAAKYGDTREIPNKATVKVNDDPKVTNEVKVVPPPEEFVPDKKINGDVQTVELEGRDETFTYTVSQKVPYNATSVTLEDTLEDVLEVVGMPAIDASGAEVTVDGNKVTAVLGEDAATAVWGQVVTLTIQAKIKEGVTDDELAEKYGDEREIPNKATVTINDDPKDTNEVKVVPPPEEFVPEKKVNGDVATVELEARDETFTYTVSQKVPYNAVSVTLEDTLEDVLEVIRTPEIDVSGGTVTVEGNKVTAVLGEEAAVAARGQVVTLTIIAKIHDGVTDEELIEKYGDAREVPNKATVTINDDPKDTNEVKIVPPYEEFDPEKKINGDVATVELEARDETFTYTVSQKVPFNATSVTFEDTLEDVLEVIGTPEIDVSGGTVTVEGNKVTAVLGEDAAVAARGKVVTLTINAKIRDGVTDEELVEKYGDAREIPNKATVTINDDPKDTNEVKVVPPYEEFDPEKKINGDVATVELEARDETFTYTVSQKVPFNATSVTFEDTLEDVLEVVGTPEVDADGAEVTVDGNKVTAVLGEDAAVAARGQVVTLTIQAKIRDGVTDDELVEKYGSSREIPNKATVTINDDPKDTNEVKVVPPYEEFDPEKKINGDVQTVELANRDDLFTYTVNQKVPYNATSVTFEDTLEDVLEIAVTPALSVGGGTVTVDGNKVTAVLEDDAAVAVRGQVVTLTIIAKIKDDVTDEELIEKYGEAKEIPNEATVKVNDDPKVTNEVKVVPPSEPEKKINGDVQTVELEGRDETFTYTVSQKVPNNATSVTFEDTLEDVLEVIGTPEVDADGAEVTVDGNKVTAILGEDAAAAAHGQVVTLTIQAKIKDGVTDDELAEKYGSTREIPNKATVAVNNNPKVTNEVKVVPPPEEFVPDKKINGDVQTVELEGRDETFTYTVSQKVPYNATSVTLEDTLEDVLEVVGTPAIDASGAEVTVDGNKVTAVLGEDAATAVWGQVVTLTIQAKIKEGVTDDELVEKYGVAREIPNKATITIDDDPKDTNEVKVVPPPEEFEPEKKINGDVETVELEARDETFTYTVSQKVPYNATSVTFEDTLEDVLEVIGTPEVDADGAEVTVDGNKVTAVLGEEAAVAARGQVVTLTIQAKIRDGVTDDELVEKYGSSREIPNKATVTINDDPKDTNEVKVVPPYEEFEPDKKINGDVETVELEGRDETFTYTVSQKVPYNATSVTFEDTLEDVLEVIGTPEVDTDGAEVTVDGNKVTAVLGEEAAASARGKVVTLTIQAKIRDGVTDEELIEKYGDAREIPNKATVTINDDPKDTDEVRVVPPYEEFDPEKKINGDVETVELKARDEAFTYTVSQKVPFNATSVTFEDTLEDVLEVIGTPEVDTDGAEVTVDGNKVTAVLGEEAAVAARGKVVTLTIRAKIRDGITDDELVEKYGDTREIPNKATVTINDDPKDTNEVKVVPPYEEFEPDKKVNGDVQTVELEGRDETFTYTVSQKVPYNATSVTFEDTLEDVLEVIGTPEVDTDGAEVTVDGNKVTAVLGEDAAASARGKVVTLTIKAKISDSVTDKELIEKYGDEREIPNKATVTVNDDPKDTNEVKIVPPYEEFEPEKKINGDVQTVELEGRDETFTYTVSQKVPFNATSVTLEDTLEEVLEVIGTPGIDADGAKVTVDGNKVTAVLGEDAAVASRGKVVTLTIKAKIREDVTDLELVEKYGDSMEIPNKATVTVNDDPKDTNEVRVVPPTGEHPAPEKFINGQKAKVTLSERSEVFTYTVTQKVPADANTIVFTDTLESVLEITKTPSVDADGAQIEVNGNTVKATLSGDAAVAVRGKTVTLTIKAKIRDGVTDSQLTAKYGTTDVPNKATVSINGVGKTTNEVLVKPPVSKTPPTPPRKTTRTGDSSNAALWIILLIAAAAGIVAVAYNRRKMK